MSTLTPVSYTHLSEIPQMTVLGIAGPGDALANPKKTFETFRRLQAEAPDLSLIHI